MSTIREELDRVDSYEALTPREQLLGTSSLMLVILLAIVLKSL